MINVVIGTGYQFNILIVCSQTTENFNTNFQRCLLLLKTFEFIST